MLVGQDGCGYQHSNLFVVACCFEGGSYGYFCLAESHVSAYESVHWSWAFHVGLDILCGLELVGGIFVGEACFEFVLHESVSAVGVSLFFLSFGVKEDEVTCDVFDFVFDFFLHAFPCSSAYLVECGCFAFFALVF